MLRLFLEKSGCIFLCMLKNSFEFLASRKFYFQELIASLQWSDFIFILSFLISVGRKVSEDYTHEQARRLNYRTTWHCHEVHAILSRLTCIIVFFPADCLHPTDFHNVSCCTAGFLESSFELSSYSGYRCSSIWSNVCSKTKLRQ